MNIKTESTKVERLINYPEWFMLRGLVMLVLGVLLLMFSMLVPNVEMLGVQSSWILFCSILILIAGVLRAIDAYISDRVALKVMNMQSSIIDLVCGFVILTSLGKTALTLSLIVAAYLMIQGLFRLGFIYLSEIPNPHSARIGGIVSVLLGMMVWLQWPFNGLWFLSFALSTEIANRGWALIFYARSVRNAQID
jgi:uncharacterized membrane protein HdeD (DUF308 family)